MDQHTNNNASHHNKFNSQSVPSPSPNLSHRFHPSGSIDDKLLLLNADPRVKHNSWLNINKHISTNMITNTYLEQKVIYNLKIKI
mmetsp:Transcript_42986/g.50288  ORF Transcript_42986/g.50288 Transcript_42986/m.50288 type:complete len:85 (-) Transcript_42986:102-356(-)